MASASQAETGNYENYLKNCLEERKKTFLRNYELVLQAPLPDAVHDLRVSIRRLNAIVALIEKLSQASKREIRDELKNLMKPLGVLRDVQVRIEWLKELKCDENPAGAAILAELAEEERNLITSLPEYLESSVVDEIKKLEPENFIEELTKAGESRGDSLAVLCHDEITRLLAKFERREKRFHETGETRDLHRARIAFKRFRYTIEIFYPFYPHFDAKELNSFQTKLGDFHDLDLMLNWLKTKEKNAFAEKKDDFEKLMKKLEEEKNKRFEKVKKDIVGKKKLLTKWREFMKKEKKKSGKKEKSQLADLRHEIISLCERFDPDPPHAKYVSALALKLFDEFAKRGLHDLDDKYRTLLDYGCLLHDIGWVDGQRKHHKRSFEMIMASDLPISKQNKLVIALIARFHRKADPDKKGSYHTLQGKKRDAIAKLAAIIRIADVLDRLHDQKAVIKEVRLDDRNVVIAVSKGSLSGLPQDAVAKKTAFFAKAYGKPVMLVEQD